MPTTDHNTAATQTLAQLPLHAAIQASVHTLWQQAGLPAQALQPGALALSGDGTAYPSSFCIDVAAPAAVAASGLASAWIDQHRQQLPMPPVNVDVGHVLAECSGYFTIDGEQPNLWAPSSGLYACGADLGEPGWLRIHANFDHHRDGVLRLLGLLPGQHFTEPPPRYTEATLVRALEEDPDLEDIAGVFREPLPRVSLDALPDEGAWLQPFRPLSALLVGRQGVS